MHARKQGAETMGEIATAARRNMTAIVARGAALRRAPAKREGETWAGIFVAHADDTFTCGACVGALEERTTCERCDGTGTCDDYDHVYEGNCLECDGFGSTALDPSDDAVETWEEGSNGWTGPIACRVCKRSIPVVCDAEPPHGPREGLRLLRLARAHLQEAPRTLARVRYAIKSAEGAARHADLGSRERMRARRAAEEAAREHIRAFGCPGADDTPGGKEVRA